MKVFNNLSTEEQVVVVVGDGDETINVTIQDYGTDIEVEEIIRKSKDVLYFDTVYELFDYERDGDDSTLAVVAGISYFEYTRNDWIPLLSVNMLAFGVKPNTGKDSWKEAQACIDYCYEHRVKCIAPAGTITIKRPLRVRGNDRYSPGTGSVHIQGMGRETTTFRKDTTTVLDLPEPYNKNAIFILTGNEIGNSNHHCRNLYMGNFACMTNDSRVADYAIYVPPGIELVDSHLHDILTRNCKKGFWADGGNTYLNSFDRIRIERCEYGFVLNGGINTSLRISDVYVVRSTKVGFILPTQYSVLVNPACDSALGVCYDLKNFRGEVISPGAESVDADCVFSFVGTGDYGKNQCVITAPYTLALKNENAEHIRMTVGSVLFVGGHINLIEASMGVSSGKLLEYYGPTSVPNNLIFDNVEVNGFGKTPETFGTGRHLEWRGWEHTRAAKSTPDNVEYLIQDGSVRWTKSGKSGAPVWKLNGELVDVFGNTTNSLDAAKGITPPPIDNNNNKTTRQGIYYTNKATENPLTTETGILLVGRNDDTILQCNVTNKGIITRCSTDGGNRWITGINMESDLNSKVDKTINITAGRGLLGGGDLSTNRAINVNFGTSAGTVMQGNDPRVVNALTKEDLEDIISKDVGNRVEVGSDGGIYYSPVLLSSPLEAYKEARDSGV